MDKTPPDLAKELARAPLPLSWAEKALLGAFLVALVLFAWLFLAAGSNGTGYLAVRIGNTALHLIEAYAGHAFAFVVGAILVQIMFLPRITVHIAAGRDEPPETLRVWYIPGSLHLMGDSWTWREPGGKLGRVHRRHFTKTGLLGGWMITTEVDRNRVGRDIHYETADVEVTQSAAKDAQIRLLSERSTRAELMAANGGSP